MKKFLIIFLIFIAILFGLSVFVNTTYFFNKYIAANIKQYGFGYDRVNGALLRGFNVENLTYKSKPLSAEAELKFNPLKLLYKKISVSKLRLIAVNKETLQKVIDDFRPKEDSSSSTNISFNFEIKDILLTIKPFSFEGLRVKKNALSVDYIEYAGDKFNIGRVDYQAKTTIGNVNFTGKYEHRILNIDTISLKNFNLKKFLPILKDANKVLNSNESNVSENEGISVALVPKIVNVKNAKLSLSPFRNKDISSKDLKVKISNAQFSVQELQLKKANLTIEYLSDIVSANAAVNIKDRNLNIKNLKLAVIKPNHLIKIYQEYLDKNSSNSNGNGMPVDILKLKKVSLNKALIELKDFKINKENINSVKIQLNGANYDLNSSKLKIKNYDIVLNSTILTAKIKGLINKKLLIKNAQFESANTDKLIFFIKNSISKNSDKNNGNKKLPIPDIFYIEKLSVSANRLSFKPFVINRAKIQASKVEGKIKKFKLEKGNLKAEVSSNWGDAGLVGLIKDNNYYAKGHYKATQKLFDEYNIPLIAKNLEALKVNGRFGFKNLELTANLQGRDILKNIKKLDILSSKNKFIYDYSSGNILWTIDAKVNSVYSGKANLINTLTYKNKLEYYGKLIPEQKLEFSKKLENLFNALSLSYKGNDKKIDIDFTTAMLRGVLKSNSYKGGKLTITNRVPIKLASIVNIGNGFKNALVSRLKIEAPIVYEKILPIKGKMDISSNIGNISGDWEYKDGFKSKFKFKIPKNSLIVKKVSKVNISAISPLNIDLSVFKNNLNIKYKNNYINGEASYVYDSKKIAAKLSSGSTLIKADGTINNIKLILNSKSIKNSLKDINRFYKIASIPNLTGSLIITANIKGLKTVEIDAKSTKIIYDKKSKIKNIALKARYKDGIITLNSYKFKLNGYNFFASNPSKIKIDSNNINIRQLWINNSLLADGNYNTKNSKGVFKLKSNNFKIDNSDVKVNLALNANIKIAGKKIAADGKIDIINGIIRKNLKSKNVAENEDIIILQRKAAKENTNFAKNIKLNLSVVSQNGIRYAQDGSNFLLKPKLKITKNYGSLSNFRGVVNIQKGGYYILNGKKLILKKGIITFKGKSSSPNLNIVLAYHGSEYDISINVSGTPTRPVLYFSSNPPLAKDQILAYLLFDDSTAAGTHSQEAMMSLVGGALAKSFLGSIGIKIDHISIKQNGFSVGKSLGKHIIIYYNQEGEKSSVKTRVNITNSIKTEIEVGGESQSADIIFSKEY